MARSSSAAALVAAAVIVLGACGGGGGPTVTQVTQPSTDAKLVIVAPTPNEVTGSTVTLRFKVIGATISPPDRYHLVPNEGHIHVSIDGKLIVMAYTSTTTVTGLSPGLHVLLAQFVANNHLPFSDPVSATVFFTVKG